MRYIQIDKLEAGMVLGNPIYDENYRILLSEKKKLTQNLIDKLSDMGYSGVYIEDELSEGIEVESVIPPQLCAKGMNCVKNGDIDGCMRVSKEIIEEILSKGTISMDMLDLQEYEDYTYSHSVNVATIAGVIGMGKGLTRNALEHLVLAGLLHDLGKMEIPLEILNKPSKLSPEEYEQIKQHPIFSYESIKDRWDISAEIKVAVLYHHENVDGTGYPKGQTGSKQILFTKILHVADVFDALVSKRPYKNPYSPRDACEFMMANCDKMFDMDCVKLLLKYVPLYPKGTEVTLSDGRRGIIFKNSGEHNLRPVVRLMDKTLLDLNERENMGLIILNPEDSEKRSERDKQ